MKDIRNQWKALAAAKKITYTDVAALCVYRALNKLPDPDGTRVAIMQGYGKEGAIHRLRKSFSPITNHVKLTNGSAPFGTLTTALRMLKYSQIMDWLDPDDAKAIINLGLELSKENFQ